MPLTAATDVLLDDQVPNVTVSVKVAAVPKQRLVVPVMVPAFAAGFTTMVLETVATPQVVDNV